MSRWLAGVLLLCGAAHAQQPYAYIVEVGDWPAGTAKLHCYYSGAEAEARVEIEKGPARLIPVAAPLAREEVNRLWAQSKVMSTPGTSQLESFAALVRLAR